MEVAIVEVAIVEVAIVEVASGGAPRNKYNL